MKSPRTAIAGLALSAAALIGVALQEGYEQKAYVPTKGDKVTIGFGTTTRPDGTPVQMGDKTNPVEALQRKQRDLVKFEGAIKRCVTVPLYQHEYDAYVDMAYNIGPSAFCKSTMVRRLNTGDYRGACDAILLWTRVGPQDCAEPGNKICWGLWERRKATHMQCLGES